MAATAHFLTPTITRLQLMRGSRVVGIATGFFLKDREGKWVIVTNWHVLSGRDPSTGQPRHTSGAVPDTCRYFPAHFVHGSMVWPHVDIPLGDALLTSATWFQHPTEGQAADVAILPLPNANVGLAKNLLEHDPDMFLDLGAEVFLPGFPLGITGGGLLPIWKRASIASSLEFGEGQNKYFLVDTATREGMSGAPCLAVSNWRHYRLDRPTNRMSVVDQPVTWRLLGVYSGRLNPSDSFEAQLGLVWRDSLIFETLEAQTRARVILKS